MKSKKKVLGEFISNFKTYTRYSWVADEEQKMVVLLEGAIWIKLKKNYPKHNISSYIWTLV